MHGFEKKKLLYHHGREGDLMFPCRDSQQKKKRGSAAYWATQPFSMMWEDQGLQGSTMPPHFILLW